MKVSCIFFTLCFHAMMLSSASGNFFSFFRLFYVIFMLLLLFFKHMRVTFVTAIIQNQVITTRVLVATIPRRIVVVIAIIDTAVAIIIIIWTNITATTTTHPNNLIGKPIFIKKSALKLMKKKKCFRLSHRFWYPIIFCGTIFLVTMCVVVPIRIARNRRQKRLAALAAAGGTMSITPTIYTQQAAGYTANYAAQPNNNGYTPDYNNYQQAAGYYAPPPSYPSIYQQQS